MRFVRLSIWLCLYCITTVYFLPDCFSQPESNTVVTGTVLDATTGDPLPFVTVVLENTTAGTITNDSGHFRIVTFSTSYKISFSFVGYETVTHIIYPGKTQIVNISLYPLAVELSEVVVKPSNKSYHNKNNPAVELIDKVIENRDRNRMAALDYYSCHKYEKLAFSLSSMKEDIHWPKAMEQIRLLLENVDTTRIDGKKNIPLYLKETISDVYHRSNPKADKEIIKAEKSIGLDKYIDNKGLVANIKYLYQDIDIYNSEIFFLSNKFLSPVANSAPMFYRYYIIDTSMVSNVNCIQLFFEPRNPSDFLFHGFLYITADSAYAIKRIDISFNKSINIDWVKDIRIVQDFEKPEGDAWALVQSDISIDFGFTQDLPGIYGQKEVWYNNFSTGKPIADTVFSGPDKVTRTDPSENLPGYWTSARISPLTDAQRNLYSLIDSIQQTPAFQRRMKIVMLMTSSFLDLGTFDMGPVGTFYSFNEIEGSRLKLGGRTTESFNRWLYLDGYLAYGFKDKQYKYRLGLTYSLTGKTIYKFPVRAVSLSYQYETATPGQMSGYVSQDYLLLSFKRGVDDKIFYNRSFELEYENELENHFSWDIGYRYLEQTAGGNLHFNYGENLPGVEELSTLKIPEVSVNLRYAPKEEFYQGKIYRSPIASRYPVIRFESAFGSKSLNNDYDYQKIIFGVSKRFYLSIIGYTDVSAEAGKIFGNVPYPILFIHYANQSYIYAKESYNMMNFLEFVSDKYVSLNIDHSFNGFILNKVPVIKMFKLREVATLKMLYGGLSRQNDPGYNSDLFKFPTDASGNPTTFILGREPYVEASVGLSNILRILRVDLIKRFTYLDNPNVSSLGVRVQLRIDI